MLDSLEKFKEIQRSLPHRYPFLLVDDIKSVDLKKNIICCIKNVTINEPYFSGHFPGNPVMPGVLMIESIAQTSGILAYKIMSAEADENDDLEYTYYLAGANNCRFKRIVTPGDKLYITSNLVARKSHIWKFEGEVRIDNNELACSVEITCAARRGES